jgi:hypothetical protein
VFFFFSGREFASTAVETPPLPAVAFLTSAELLSTSSALAEGVSDAEGEVFAEGEDGLEPERSTEATLSELQITKQALQKDLPEPTATISESGQILPPSFDVDMPQVAPTSGAEAVPLEEGEIVEDRAIVQDRASEHDLEAQSNFGAKYATLCSRFKVTSHNTPVVRPCVQMIRAKMVGLRFARITPSQLLRIGRAPPTLCHRSGTREDRPLASQDRGQTDLLLDLGCLENRIVGRLEQATRGMDDPI